MKNLFDFFDFAMKLRSCAFCGLPRKYAGRAKQATRNLCRHVWRNLCNLRTKTAVNGWITLADLYFFSYIYHTGANVWQYQE
jgi:hypothetical protein